MTDTLPRPLRPVRILLLQLVVCGMLAVAVLSWDVLVPHWLHSEHGLSERLRSYPALLVPLCLAALAVLYWRLRRLQSGFDALAAGRLYEPQVQRLVARAVRLPFVVFAVTALGVALLSVLVAWRQSRHWDTPPRDMVAALLLATSHGLVLATMLFGACRWALRPLLALPVATLPAAARQPDLFWRLLIYLAGTVSAVWIALGALIVSGVCGHRQVAALGACHHPVVAATVLALDIGWVGLLLVVALVAYLWTREKRQRLESIVDNLERAAGIEQAASIGSIPITSVDELALLNREVNRLTRRLAEHALALREGAIEAEANERRQERFLTAISHDLRTPLHSIIGFAELLAEDPALSDDQREDARVILRSAHHLQGLVDDIVELTRLESGRLAINRRRLDLAAVIAEAADAVLPPGPQRQLLRLQLPEQMPAVWGDQGRLRQVLINLLANAVKYSEGSSIHLTARVLGGMVEVAVEDEGPGLPDEYLERIFEEYERATAGTQVTGTGLGLAISRHLVELHGGTISAANRPQGGARFSFSIPLAREQEVA